MFERRHQPLLPRSAFFRRVANFGALGLAIVVGSLIWGTCGYHFLQGLSWLDSVLNAAMILTGMGPVNVLTRPAAKVFATFYALYAGIVFLAVASLWFAPIFHRFIHRFHLELDDEDAKA